MGNFLNSEIRRTGSCKDEMSLQNNSRKACFAGLRFDPSSITSRSSILCTSFLSSDFGKPFLFEGGGSLFCLQVDDNDICSSKSSSIFGIIYIISDALIHKRNQSMIAKEEHNFSVNCVPGKA